MKAAKITIILVIIVSLILWCRSDYDIGHIARVLPFSSGNHPGLYNLAAIVLIVLAFRGLARLRPRSSSQEQPPADTDEYELDDDSDSEYCDEDQDDA